MASDYADLHKQMRAIFANSDAPGESGALQRRNADLLADLAVGTVRLVESEAQNGTGADIVVRELTTIASNAIYNVMENLEDQADRPELLAMALTIMIAGTRDGLDKDPYATRLTVKEKPQ